MSQIRWMKMLVTRQILDKQTYLTYENREHVLFATVILPALPSLMNIKCSLLGYVRNITRNGVSIFLWTSSFWVVWIASWWLQFNMRSVWISRDLNTSGIQSGKQKSKTKRYMINSHAVICAVQLSFPEYASLTIISIKQPCSESTFRIILKRIRKFFDGKPSTWPIEIESSSIVLQPRFQKLLFTLVTKIYDTML